MSPPLGLDNRQRTELSALLRMLARDRGMAERIDTARLPVALPATALGASRRQIVLRGQQLSAWFGHRRTVPVLNGVDLALTSGSALAVVGASGAGNTTLALTPGATQRGVASDRPDGRLSWTFR
jgi:ABC-type glutathione transport system ATPase component